MESSLSNKTVLVTGASRGIGRAISVAFALQGAKVILHYNKNNIAAEETLAEMQGNDHVLVQADLSDPEAIHEMVEKIAKSDRSGAKDYDKRRYTPGRQVSIFIQRGNGKSIGVGRNAFQRCLC